MLGIRPCVFVKPSDSGMPKAYVNPTMLGIRPCVFVKPKVSVRYAEGLRQPNHVGHTSMCFLSNRRFVTVLVFCYSFKLKL